MNYLAMYSVLARRISTIAGAAALLLLGVGCLPWGAPAEPPQPLAVTEEGTEQPVPVKEFSVTAKSWEFEPSEIRVKEGDRVRLAIKSIDVNHGFGLPAFGVNVTLAPGKTETVEFTADRTGTFTFFCSVLCGSGHQDMTGKLIVE